MKFKDLLNLTGWSKKQIANYFEVDYNTVVRWGNDKEPKDYMLKLMFYKLFNEEYISFNNYRDYLEEKELKNKRFFYVVKKEDEGNLEKIYNDYWVEEGFNELYEKVVKLIYKNIDNVTFNAKKCQYIERNGYDIEPLKKMLHIHLDMTILEFNEKEFEEMQDRFLD